MPDSYAICLTGVGRGRIVRWDNASIMTAFAATNPTSMRIGKYSRPIVSQFVKFFTIPVKGKLSRAQCRCNALCHAQRGGIHSAPTEPLLFSSPKRHVHQVRSLDPPDGA